MTLKRNAYPVSGTTATQVDDLEYKYIGNYLNQVIEHSSNTSGYEGGDNFIAYDLNGNMTDMKDKGIQSIGYNYLNLPNAIGIQHVNPIGNISATNINHLYRADGAKLRKTYNQQAYMGLPTTRMTDYLDGFQYSYIDDGSMCITCRTETAYEPQAYSKIKNPIITTPAWKLDFVPTSEGFYSFVENRYIYNYKDHLGNVRVTFAKDNAGVVQSIDTNNYYPFGLNHIGGSSYSNFGSYYNYKFGGKELQETGWNDFGARMYMSDLGRWGVIDPLAEKMTRHSPYNYAFNNPINFVDPDGRESLGWGLKDNMWQYVEGMQEGDATYQEKGFTSFLPDGSIRPNVQITNSNEGNTGLTYLGFNGNVSYIPTDGSNGSVAMLGLATMFSDAFSKIESAISGLIGSTNEEFPQITNTGGLARTDFDATTHDKLRPGDKTFILDAGSFVFPSTFPVEGSAGGRGYALSWVTDRMADIFNLNKGSGTDTLFMKATFVGQGKDFLRDTMFAEPWRKNETYEQVYNRQIKKYDSVKTNSKIFLTR
ncbi:RHS repeat-associated core domain-containing protein [Chryseobacterium aureum]|uniref:RHS repeat-associated core domain-containing protein n=1 Tax=Chryseobacterium aureum TaxID=2497456 RepID=UPI000F8681D7|nr:RHS repeat-associated core domain-containing protein [Chryseobacterium aureum]